MKNTYIHVGLLFAIVFTLSSFNTNNACKNIGSNIGFIRTQTKKAIEANDINITKYYAYKALNAIEKSKKEFKNCGCHTAELSLNRGLENLKSATKETSISNAKVLLKEALKNTLGSLIALKEYNTSTLFPSNVLVVNTIHVKKKYVINSTKSLHEKIDKTLINFEHSLNNVINTLECKKAYEYTNTVFVNCEKKLLNGNLTEGKKYYNLRTKEITSNALKKLNNCAKK